MARRLPPRDSKGRFVSRRGSRRGSRRNPPVVDTIMDGALGGAQALGGKIVVRLVPDLVGLQRTGNVGVAIQTATAIGLGLAAERFLTKDTAKMVLAGALMAPMEQLIADFDIPMLAPALSGYGYGMGLYVPGGAPLGSYVEEPTGGRFSPAENGMGAYAWQG